MNIVETRINRGLSLAAASEQMHISRGALRRAESGEMPRESVAKKIADFYGVQVTTIWPLEGRSAA